MVCLEEGRILHQDALDAALQHPDYPLHLPMGLIVANGSVEVDNSRPFAELHKAA